MKKHGIIYSYPRDERVEADLGDNLRRALGLFDISELGLEDRAAEVLQDLCVAVCFADEGDTRCCCCLCEVVLAFLTLVGVTWRPVDRDLFDGEDFCSLSEIISLI
eukprot:gene906-biopygen3284